ncbi:MAG TPA: rod-binding protein [Lacipirellulaceae bacterium]|nr:rod-binding protein [Lacipirellulaceae bacterium]
MQINSYNAAVASQLPAMPPPRGNSTTAFSKIEPSPSASLRGRGNVDALREQFSQFVGETFFGQMIKSLRATTQKPAYFHGGRAEEVFQSQLDQQLAQHLTEASAEQFAEPMFERQFPGFADKQSIGLNTLTELRRF